jgi:hypothetical protein
MAITFANVATTDNFSTWLTRTNQIANAFVQVVSVESNTATGNAAVSGYFVANGFVGNNITVTGSAGGNLTVSSANLVIAANAKLSAVGFVAIKNTMTIDTLSSVNTGTAANATHYLLAANSANGSSWYYAAVPTSFSGNSNFDSGTLFVDSVNNRVGVNNTTPDAALTVTGTANISGNVAIGGGLITSTNNAFQANATFSDRIIVTNFATFSNSITVTNTATFSNTITVSGNVIFGTTRITANGGVGTAGQVLTSGAGTGNVYWSSAAAGTITNIASGDGLTGGPITSTGTLSVLAGSGIIANSSGLFVNATAIAVGTLPITRGGTGTSTATGTGSVVLSASPTFTGTINAQILNIGNTSISGNLSVDGFANIISTANVGGAVNLRSTLAVNGAVTIVNTMAVGNTTLTGTLSVSGNVATGNVLTTGNNTTTGNTTISGTLNVANGIVLSTNAVALGIEQSLTLALSDETTTITTGTAKITFRAPFAWTLTRIPRASLATASVSGNPTVDINVNGSTILSTKLTIDENEKTSTTAGTAAVLSSTSIADDAEITMDIDVAGGGAKGLKVTLYYKRA